MRRRVEYYDEDSMGKRLGRFVGALCAIFIITVAVVLTQRLSDESLANATFAVLGAGLRAAFVTPGRGGTVSGVASRAGAS